MISEDDGDIVYSINALRRKAVEASTCMILVH